MSPHSKSPFLGFLLMVSLGSCPLIGQEIEGTEVQFLDIQAKNSGSSLEIKFILTADQYVERIAMENSYDLQTWQTNEIYPNWDFDVEGQISFLSTPFGRTFYRAGIVLPSITLLQDSVIVANGRQSDQVTFAFSDPAFPFDFPELEAVSSNSNLIPQNTIDVVSNAFSSSIRVTPTFDGVGDVPIDLIVTGSDGVTAKATLTVTVVEGGGLAPSLVDLYTSIQERKFPGLDFVFSTTEPPRFSRKGEPGNWFYQLDAEDATKAILGFTYDENNHDFNVHWELITLTFVTDRSGNYKFQELMNETELSSSSGSFDLDAFPVVGAGAAPTEAAFARMAVGKHIVNDAWTFDTATRFNYTEPGGSPEPGNWKYVMTGEKTGRVTLTYDEDNNNASIYREEVDLTFETLETGSLTYREYEGADLNNSFPGVFDFSE